MYEKNAVRAEVNGPVSLAIEQTYQNTDCKASLLLAVLPLTITLLFAFWYRVRENITPLSAWGGGGF